MNNIVPLDNVMKMADLSRASTFQTFYYKPVFKAKYTHSVFKKIFKLSLELGWSWPIKRTFDVATSALLLSIFSYPAPLLHITRQGVEFYLIFSHMFRTEFV